MCYEIFFCVFCRAQTCVPHLQIKHCIAVYGKVITHLYVCNCEVLWYIIGSLRSTISFQINTCCYKTVFTACVEIRLQYAMCYEAPSNEPRSVALVKRWWEFCETLGVSLFVIAPGHRQLSAEWDTNHCSGCCSWICCICVLFLSVWRSECIVIMLRFG